MTDFTTPVGTLSWTRARVPRSLSTVAKGLYVGTSVLVALAIAADFAWFAPLFGLSQLAAAALWIASYVLSLTQTTFPGALAIRGGVLHVGQGRAVAVEALDGALVVERTAGGVSFPTVEIQLADGDRLTARFSDVAMARSLVDALGFGPRGRRVRTSLGTPLRRLVHLGYGLTAYVGASVVGAAVSFVAANTIAWSIGWALMPAVGLALYELVRKLLDAPTVTVGEDGVRVERALRARTEPLRSTQDLGSFVLVDGERRAALERLAAERASASGVSADRRDAFSRDGNAIAEWRTRVGNVVANASYRGAAVTVDDARATLRSSDSTPEQRVGAALALRAAGEPPERIRVAAEGFVDERLRIALEAVAADDDARADDALRKMAR